VSSLGILIATLIIDVAMLIHSLVTDAGLWVTFWAVLIIFVGWAIGRDIDKLRGKKT
jgi:hypothetical protein